MKLTRHFTSFWADKSPPKLVPPGSKEDLAGLEHFVWLLSRRPTGGAPALAESCVVDIEDDMPLLKRVMDSYKLAMTEFRSSSGWWDNQLFSVKEDIHNALLGESIENAAPFLRNPASNTFFWGFDAIASSPAGEPEPHELVLRRLNSSIDWRNTYALWVCDALISFAEAIGARRAAYPEVEVSPISAMQTSAYSVDAIIDEIEAVLGVKLQFPNPFPSELGLPSKRGIVGFRAVQSAYQAWRIAQIANKNPNFKVMEIGAGLGRTAYYANLFGVSNYTIVDIPLTNAAQGNFLGRVLGQNNVALHGESIGGPLRIIPSTAIDRSETYDLVVNVDSWTEMSIDVAKMYWDYAKKASKTVLSINHEFNAHTVRELYNSDPAVKALRYPYCMRRGYVEELLTWD